MHVSCRTSGAASRRCGRVARRDTAELSSRVSACRQPARAVRAAAARGPGRRGARQPRAAPAAHRGLRPDRTVSRRERPRPARRAAGSGSVDLRRHRARHGAVRAGTAPRFHLVQARPVAGRHRRARKRAVVRARVRGADLFRRAADLRRRRRGDRHRHLAGGGDGGGARTQGRGAGDGARVEPGRDQQRDRVRDRHHAARVAPSRVPGGLADHRPAPGLPAVGVAGARLSRQPGAAAAGALAGQDRARAFRRDAGAGRGDGGARAHAGAVGRAGACSPSACCRRTWTRVTT